MDKKAINLLLLLIVVEIIAWYFLKKYSVDKTNIYLTLYLLFFLTIPFILLKIVNTEGIAVTNSLWNVATTTLVLFLGMFIFDENINKRQLFGVTLGVVSIVFITFSK
jgi:multidrug transporter EmrE-like cation transporter